VIQVELHSHTCWSKDCVIDFPAILRLMDKRGIDKIAITDHNTAEGAKRFAQTAPDRVIVGEEIMTDRGEILAYYVQETIPAGLTPDETIRRLRDQGAVISVSHPYDRLRKGAWHEADLVAIADRVDAIEGFNARCIYAEDNAKALAFAREHHLPITVGSDAHSRVEYGRALMRSRPFHDAATFLAALQDAEHIDRYSSWLVHFNSTAAKWSKKLGLTARLWEGG
jgi:predicted metal-dependent phosphoesterase TrpH